MADGAKGWSRELEQSPHVELSSFYSASLVVLLSIRSRPDEQTLHMHQNLRVRREKHESKGKANTSRARARANSSSRTRPLLELDEDYVLGDLLLVISLEEALLSLSLLLLVLLDSLGETSLQPHNTKARREGGQLELDEGGWDGTSALRRWVGE